MFELNLYLIFLDRKNHRYHQQQRLTNFFCKGLFSLAQKKKKDTNNVTQKQRAWHVVKLLCSSPMTHLYTHLWAGHAFPFLLREASGLIPRLPQPLGYNLYNHEVPLVLLGCNLGGESSPERAAFTGALSGAGPSNKEMVGNSLFLPGCLGDPSLQASSVE